MPELWSGSTKPAVVGSIAHPGPEALLHSLLIRGTSVTSRVGRDVANSPRTVG